MAKKVLVTGGGIDGIEVALELAGRGVAVTLLEESTSLQVNPSGENAQPQLVEALPLMPRLLKAAADRNISIITGASLEQVKGERGNFRVKLLKHPRYVNIEACASCGRCERECPVLIAPPSANGSSHKAIHRPGYGLKSVPSTYTIEKKGTPPCTATCPAGINVHGYVALVAKGKFAEALDVITEAVAFPRVLGRVCSHPCQGKCTRARVDQAVSICALKRFVGDSNSAESSLRKTHTAKNGMKLTGPPRVAIIGAGPAGLTAARDLARFGHKATVFETLPVPGGMITVGMPRFRLPREVRQADISSIERLGIEIRTSTPIGKGLTLTDLRQQGYEAILIATGAHKNQRLGVPGENLSGVIDSIALLRALNLKQPITVGKKVVVIGGGYTAIDSARTAVRLHCDRVTVLYRRSQEEMPANVEEVAEAREEGVKFEFLVTPVRIVGEKDRVVGVECIRMRLGEPDQSGRRRPLTVGGSEFVVAADAVIVAVGQRPDLAFLEGDINITDGKKYVVIDPVTMATKVPGIFAAGDVAGESGTLIQAITAGRRAAISIDLFLRGQTPTRESFPARAAPVEVKPEEMYVPPIARQAMPCLPLKARVGNFEEVDLGLTAEMAVKEAQRCLNCAGCSECLECERACELKAIDHSATPERLELQADVVITAADAGSGGVTITPGPGIYSVAPTQAAAVAATVIDDLESDGETEATPRVLEAESDTPAVATSGLKRRIGVFICGCGGGISETVNIPEAVKHSKRLSGVSYSGEVGYACTSEGAAEIRRRVGEHGLTDVVLAACTCCNLDQVCFSCSDRRLSCKANLLNGNRHGVNYEFVNIREHCAWVHSDPTAATAKAGTLISAGVARASVNHRQPQPNVANGAAATEHAQAVATVDQKRCRGCGTCVTACHFEAVKLEEKRPGQSVARVSPSRCQGCGLCVARCPSGALSQHGGSDEELAASIRAILS